MSLDSVAIVVFNQQGRANDQKTQAVFRDATKIVKDTLTRAMCPGTYQLVAKDKCKWRTTKGQTICLRPSRDKSIILRVRPGDTDSCWEYALIPAADLEWAHVRSSLAAYLGGEKTDADHEITGEPPLKAQLETVLKQAATAEPNVVNASPAIPAIAAVPEVEADVSGVLLKLMAAVQRGEGYKIRLAELRSKEVAITAKHDQLVQQEAALAKEIAGVKAELESVMMEAMSLEETVAADKELKTAKELSSMLVNMSKAAP
jgi:hypothetical protein